MKLKPLESEMLLAAGYDPKSFILMKADSKGKYMHKRIIGRY